MGVLEELQEEVSALNDLVNVLIKDRAVTFCEYHDMDDHKLVKGNFRAEVFEYDAPHLVVRVNGRGVFVRPEDVHYLED